MASLPRTRAASIHPVTGVTFHSVGVRAVPVRRPIGVRVGLVRVPKIHRTTSASDGLLRDAVEISDDELVERLLREHATGGETSDLLDELAQRSVTRSRETLGAMTANTARLGLMDLIFKNSLPGRSPEPSWRRFATLLQKARTSLIFSAPSATRKIARKSRSLSNMHDFGQILHDARREFPDHTFTLYKSDVSTAFLNLPAHPIWQLRQVVVVVDNDFHIVRRLIFGSRASPRIWCSLSALLCWIAIHKFGIRGLLVYMDDFYGWDFGDPDHFLVFDGCLHPYRQVRRLIFWNYILCLWGNPKQLDGQRIKIIGFWVDVINFTISMPPSVVDIAIEAISQFLSARDRKVRLRDWQHLAGHLNWVLNVIPWERPALTEVYRKIAGKTNPTAWVYLNREVIRPFLVSFPKPPGFASSTKDAGVRRMPISQSGRTLL